MTEEPQEPMQFVEPGPPAWTEEEIERENERLRANLERETEERRLAQEAADLEAAKQAEDERKAAEEERRQFAAQHFKDLNAGNAMAVDALRALQKGKPLQDETLEVPMPLSYSEPEPEPEL